MYQNAVYYLLEFVPLLMIKNPFFESTDSKLEKSGMKFISVKCITVMLI